MAVSKVIYGGNTLIDLTKDEVTKDNVLEGVWATGKDGVRFQGQCKYDADTSDATATAKEILLNKTAYNNGAKILGRMVNNESWKGEILDIRNYPKCYVPEGYHDGGGYVTLPEADINNLKEANIRQGVTILGVTGEMSGSEGVKAQNKTVTPSTTETRTVTPDTGYTHLAQVTVNKIPYNESANTAGGTTVTIG